MNWNSWMVLFAFLTKTSFSFPFHRILCRTKALNYHQRNLFSIRTNDESIYKFLECEYQPFVQNFDGLFICRSGPNLAIELFWNSDFKRPYVLDYNHKNIAKRIEAPDQEFLIKAIKSSHNTTDSIIIDLTGGLGKDSLMFAAKGYRTIVVEKNKLLYLMIKDALDRLKISHEEVVNRIHLIHGDSTSCHAEILSSLSRYPRSFRTTVYLDPMYDDGPPTSAKRGEGASSSASKLRKSKPKKDMQIIQRIVPVNEDNENNLQLFKSALTFANYKVIVKRSVNAKSIISESDLSSMIQQIRPATSCQLNTVRGSKQRLDIYILHPKSL